MGGNLSFLSYGWGSPPWIPFGLASQSDFSPHTQIGLLLSIPTHQQIDAETATPIFGVRWLYPYGGDHYFTGQPPTNGLYSITGLLPA